MTQQAINQIWKASNNGDPMAEMVIGVMALEGRIIKRDMTLAVDCLRRQASYGLSWANQLYQYIQSNNGNANADYNVTRCLPMVEGGLNQIAEYGNQTSNIFAWTIVGVLMYRGEIVMQNRQNAQQFLGAAIQGGCLWARDFLKEMADVAKAPTTDYSIPVTSPSPSDVDDGPTIIDSPSSHSPKPDTPKEEDNHDYMAELEGMIGLGKVKKEVASLRNFVIVQKERRKQGMRTMNVSYHCVFSGSPGTGKTTVARIVAGIYKDLGILKKGHLVEVQRADLVAEYAGQTATKTNKKIDEALDGVLFIDEAYTLNAGDQDQFGVEAINTLLKRMEDDRDRLVVIIAGYSNEIKQFVDTNPGLESRFNRYIHFEDYTEQELMSIFVFNLKKSQYKITKEAYDYVFEVISDKVRHKDNRFGNARYVRNIFEKMVQKQADRLSQGRIPGKDELAILRIEDVQID